MLAALDCMKQRTGMHIILLSMVLVIATFFFVVTSAPASGDETTLGTEAGRHRRADFQGTQPTKKYYFPWLVTFHLTTQPSKIFGSGSILTEKWVLGSTDAFVRPSVDLGNLPFFYRMGLWKMHSAGIWAYANELEPTGEWIQVQFIDEMHIFSSPDHARSRIRVVSAESVPSDLNTNEMSPFGFSMSIALIKLKCKPPGCNGWQWQRTTLPIPLFAEWVKLPASHYRGLVTGELQKTFDRLEKYPDAFICQVGGWRIGDGRLLSHEVVYVPFDDCQTIYCGNDDRACGSWPVKGVHVCFKSVTFNEPCWTDQGSALYCEEIMHSVVAILTSAPTCGYDGLPGVYTLVNTSMLLFERVQHPPTYPALNEEQFKPPPKEDLFPANT